MKSVFDYCDYREYLKDYYHTSKAKNPAFSFRYVSAKAGFKSSATFKFIIDGKRNMTKSSIEKVSQVLKLTPEEQAYFENLVLFTQAKSDSEKDTYKEKIKLIYPHAERCV